MKKNILILITIFITSIVSSFSQSNSSIVGTWHLTKIDTGVEIPEEHRAATEQMFKLIIDNTYMTFNSDGTAVGNSLDPVSGQKKSETATYTFDGKTVTSTDDNGEVETITFDQYDGKTMTIAETESGLKMTMTFVKQ